MTVNYNLQNENKFVLLTSIGLQLNRYVDNSIADVIKDIQKWDYVIKLLIHHGTLVSCCKHLKRLELERCIPQKSNKRGMTREYSEI